MEAEKPANKRQRPKYDAAFRTEAVRRVNQDDQAAKQVAQPLAAKLCWGAGRETLEQENKPLRAQLARAETERDILTNTLTIFLQLTGR